MEEPKYISGEGLVHRFDGKTETISIIATNEAEVEILKMIMDKIILLNVNDRRKN